ncbi:histidinol dehydrogenase [Candidatus Thorarchaeota archaeon]|nr:MAG: histidinol dehydrogenase [Candidatus Thorarchaeota archaeon]
MTSSDLVCRENEWLLEFIEQRRKSARRTMPTKIEQTVSGIIKRVNTIGDKALVDYTRWFDKLELNPSEFRISKEEISSAYSKVSKKQISALKEMISRIKRVAERTLEGVSFSMDIDGTQIIQTFRPLSEIGCYVPGGEAAYPSSLIMCAVPALVAGVSRIVVCTPPKIEGVNPLILIAADMCNIEEIYQIGGPQAIIAMAFGTYTIQPVQKIVGPGNAFVAQAKRMILDRTLIDMPAGPSELLVIADDTASAKNIALDLISQAEHSRDAISILLSPSEKLCDEVITLLRELIPKSNREQIVRDSLHQNGGIFVCKSISECIQLANDFAPEHIEIVTENAKELAELITSAGLILLGDYTPVSASDYCLGVNHVLPTQGYASIYSGLSVLDFIRIVRIAETNKEALENISDTICTLAEAEGLLDHAKAIKGRFER